VDRHREAGAQARQSLRRHRPRRRHLAARRARPGRVLRGHPLPQQAAGDGGRRASGRALHADAGGVRLTGRPDRHQQPFRRGLPGSGELPAPPPRAAHRRSLRRTAHAHQLPRPGHRVLGGVRVRLRLRRPVRGPRREAARAREAADAARQPGYRAPPIVSEEPDSGWLYPGSHPDSQPPPQRRFDERVARARADYRQWAEAGARFETNEEALNSALAQAIADLKALSVFWDGRRVVSAGVPWYASPFGRDALITGFQALPVNPEIARDALLFLAAHQGKKADDFREEEPGKILHEIRRGELARTGE